MASEYRQVHPRFWSSTRGMDADVQRMALYCLTAPGSNGAGIFELSCARAGEDLSMAQSTCRILIGRVCDTLNWRYDEDARVLYIPTWWRWNCPHNPKHMIGCLKRLEGLPQTTLLQEFASNEAHLEDAPDGVLDTFRQRIGWVLAGYPIQNPNPNPEQNPNLPAASAAKKGRPKTGATKVRKPREPNPIWDAIAAEFFPSGITKRQESRVGQIVADLTERRPMPTADEISKRRARQVARWGVKADTPESLEKHWDELAAANSSMAKYAEYGYRAYAGGPSPDEWYDQRDEAWKRKHPKQ